MGTDKPAPLALFWFISALLHQGTEDAPLEQETTGPQGEPRESVPAASRLPSPRTQPLRLMLYFYQRNAVCSISVFFFPTDVIKKIEKSMQLNTKKIEKEITKYNAKYLNRRC